MSRNKIIKFVHDRTGKSYAECRKICKCAHWNEATIIAYTLADATGTLSQTISQICAVVMDAAAQLSKSLSILFDNVADSMREQSERMRALAKPFDVNKDVFNYSDLNPSEVAARFAADFCESDGTTYAMKKNAEDLKIEEMRDQIEPLSINELRKQFGLEPIDVNDPKTPVFAPYYASKAKDGKLYQNDNKGI